MFSEEELEDIRAENDRRTKSTGWENRQVAGMWSAAGMVDRLEQIRNNLLKQAATHDISAWESTFLVQLVEQQKRQIADLERIISRVQAYRVCEDGHCTYQQIRKKCDHWTVVCELLNRHFGLNI